MLSILTRTFNSKDYLDKCLSSLAHQQSRNFELIILDDASDKNYFEYLSSYVKSYDLHDIEVKLCKITLTTDRAVCMVR